MRILNSDSILQTGVCASQSSRTLCAEPLVFDKAFAQPHFSVVNCSDAVMSVFFYHVLTRSVIFLEFELLCRSVEFIFLRYSNLERWYFIFSAMAHKIRRVDVEKYAYYVSKCILCQQTSKTLVWKQEWHQIVTSQRVHTKYKWPP